MSDGPRWVLGIDPGHDGGAVLLQDGKRADFAWSWRRRRRKSGDVYVLTSSNPVPLDDQLSPAGIGHRLRVSCPVLDVLAVEGLFVPKPRPRQSHHAHMGQVRSVVTLGEVTGQLMGPVLMDTLDAGCVLVRPTAATWRPAILGVPVNASSDLCERRAIAVMTARRPLVEGLGALARDPHVAEAACIARWGFVHGR